jgi:hypothetical protein
VRARGEAHGKGGAREVDEARRRRNLAKPQPKVHQINAPAERGSTRKNV